jgi:hypothetical protein
MGKIRKWRNKTRKQCVGTDALSNLLNSYFCCCWGCLSISSLMANWGLSFFLFDFQCGTFIIIAKQTKPLLSYSSKSCIRGGRDSE